MVRKIRAKLVLRLRAEGFSGRQIAAQGMSRHSVAAVLEAADREGVGFVDVAELDEAAVYARLFPGRGEHESVHAQPDWTVVHRELARVGVTLKLLHGEYVDLDRSRFGGGWGIFRGFLNLGGTDDGIDTEGIHRGVQSLGGRVRDQ